MDRPASLEKYSLRYLHPDVGNAFIIGVIIAKQSPRKVPDDRAVWNFTLRDSPQDYINASCWGRKEAVFLLNERFQVGDVGKKSLCFQFRSRSLATLMYNFNAIKVCT